MTSVGASSRLVEMEQPRLSDFVIESTIEYCHNERVLWDVNSMNFVKLEVIDAAWQRLFTDR